MLNQRSEKLEIIRDGMTADEKTKIQYAAKYARISNYWKYFIGQSKGLRRMKVYDKKVAVEKEFTNWCSKDSLRKEKYGGALELIENAYNKNEAIAINRTYLNEAIFMGSEIMYFSFKIHICLILFFFFSFRFYHD